MVHRYDTIEKQTVAVDKLPAVWELASIQEWLIELATTLTNSTMSPTVDLFQQGFDRYAIYISDSRMP